jgi:hypothetical protein
MERPSTEAMELDPLSSMDFLECEDRELLNAILQVENIDNTPTGTSSMNTLNIHRSELIAYTTCYCTKLQL